MIPQSALRRSLISPIGRISPSVTHCFSTTAVPNERASAVANNPPARPHGIDPRWLTTMKRRVGKCISFGLKPAQIKPAGDILQQLAHDWRELLAGSEGFLTDAKRRSLYKHNVVWGEMDVMGHVNNVTYVRYAESARVNWTRNIGMHIDAANREKWFNLLNSRGIGLILRSIKVDYKFPMTFPDKITVYQKLVHNPDSALSSQSAFQLQVMILSEARQRPAARCHEDIVTYDYRKQRKTAQLPPFILEQFKTMWQLQEQAKMEWQKKIADLENRVRNLELSSWDRKDAVEDTGSA
ncbi:hypothetical protein PDE_08622 [Penicillium oxalicum 114-2]|uniref:Thioesterase domain-containing protein n=2 Tax=Penicillium oxalicum TaxID=69781 RepID=S7ZSG9_PENO1|nr:hypothetical protein PDE_08622 [Penicillium oxalicum 114-2]